MTQRCSIIRAQNHVAHHVGDEGSGCFYFSFKSIGELAAALAAEGKPFVARPARIEVRDSKQATYRHLHQHRGMVIAIITAGSGWLISDEPDERISAGDWIIIPPLTPHLSVADDDTVMIEHIVYLGAEDDVQESLPA